MVVVYQLKRNALAKAIMSTSQAIMTDYAAVITGKALQEEIDRFDNVFVPPDNEHEGIDVDLYGGVRLDGFSVKEDTCQRMNLYDCPDINLYPFKAKNFPDQYFFMVVTNVIDVRSESHCFDGLPVAAVPNSMFNVDPGHPLLSRTMLFTMPQIGENAKGTTGTVFYAKISADQESYDFLQTYHTLGLTGINELELCRNAKT